MTTFDPELIAKLADFPGKVEVFDRIDSTQTMAKRQWAANPELPLMIVANSQTGGYGKYGRHFYSPAGSGLYFSLALPIDYLDSDGGHFTIAAAVVIRRVLLNYFPDQEIDFKWVNDLYCRGKKLAGILVNQLTSGSAYALVCGVGINLSTTTFPDELKSKATSLAANQQVDRNHLLVDLLRELWRLKPGMIDSRMLSEYRRHLPMLGHEVVLSSGQDQICGQAQDVDNLGRLIVVDDHGHTHTIVSGEVTKVDPSN